MYSKIMGCMVVFLMIVMVVPSYGLTDKEIEKMSMDELTKLEIRLKKYLAIRKLESDIESAKEKGETAEKKPVPFGLDSTANSPLLQPPKNIPIKELPKPDPAVVLPVIKKAKPVPLPKIISISGEVGKSLLAQLELGPDQGFFNVKQGDKICLDRYTVISINYLGVMVQDKKGKKSALPFKPFEKVQPLTPQNSSLSISPLPPIPTFEPIMVGGDSVFPPPTSLQ